MSNLNIDQIFKENLRTYFDSENPNITFFLKFAILVDIIIRKNNFIPKTEAKHILKNEQNKKTKTISLEYDLIEENQENKESTGILKLDLIDNLIGSFAGKLDINANFKSFKNASNQNYFIPLNCNSAELKNLRFEKLNETYSPLNKYLFENLITRIFSLNNLNKLTINFDKNTGTINSNNHTGVFYNPIPQSNINYISDYNNFYSNRKKMDNNTQMNPNFIGANPNIHLTSEDIPVDKKTDLGIDKNKFFERNKGDIDFDNNEKKQENINTEDIYNNEINANNFDHPHKIGGNPKLKIPFDKRIPKQENWDPKDPDKEVFNPNYQINPNKYINPNYNEANFINPGGNNPFFSSQGGIIPGGELIGPESDIFSMEHPNMQKKPGAKIRYDPIGPFGTFGGPDKGSKHDDPFQG